MDVILKGKYIIKCKIRAVTGLHIGEGNNSIEIGGIDNAVVKDAEGKPYIPGSSLKGKMRALMEFAEGKVKDDLMVVAVKKGDKPEICLHMCDDKDCPVCGLFGRNHGLHDKKSGGKIDLTDAVIPTRLIVRDAKLIESSITDEMKENLDLEWTEVKFENNIDRITSKAHPRQSERVPAGAEFSAEFVVNRYEVDGSDDGEKYLSKFIKAMKLLEDDYLGGQGSRGNGKVKFVDIEIFYKDSSDYEKDSNDLKPIATAPSLDQL
ncbi:CRISPR-associated RAMP protein, Csm3 family [Caldicellulosiruptor saccharolyticus DSM 8903]|uniref:CRISPR system Cms endoribonuclease Csm3 n=1 Tax=Caldicellulosiruptor saccharolyticus (strain ATCC 43494 / DSM 8903 / Tp8T 6331) TaxID=351627 RepID=A4XFP6_CALS8|nr:type III-A CRISPR-associated RAMP protein Csm3 [Caldicellulosiruptor saccharolyticus]ABP65731.1 CRISPR-associated RAMP protein, Csm3 family [Caldicellulosiruptor saccharolyticus DSM 8903]